MQVYAGMDPRLPLRDVPAYARRIEAMGFDGLHVAETVHDSLAVALLVAEHTERLTIRTSVTLAFVRSPTLLAYSAWDLSAFSGGRFELGLGSQIHQNVVERMGVPWPGAVDGLRRTLDVLDALFAAFRTGTFEPAGGVTRLQPYFNPGPDDSTVVPPVWLGGVNRGVVELAGERAAGLVTHPTNSSPRYVESVCLPALEAGAAPAGRPRPPVVVGPPLATGRTDEAVAAERARQEQLLGFLFTTPAYVRHGHTVDEVLVTGRHDELAPILLDRFGGLADGLVLGTQADPADDESVAALVATLRARGVR